MRNNSARRRGFEKYRFPLAIRWESCPEYHGSRGLRTDPYKKKNKEVYLKAWFLLAGHCHCNRVLAGITSDEEVVAYLVLYYLAQ
jgi:hypothetical protein